MLKDETGKDPTDEEVDEAYQELSKGGGLTGDVFDGIPKGASPEGYFPPFGLGDGEGKGLGDGEGEGDEDIDPLDPKDA